MRIGLMIAAVAVLLASRVAADEPTPLAPEAEWQTLEGFGKSNSACLEWSDGCGVCLRHDDAGVACSVPGIACQPVETSCRRNSR